MKGFINGRTASMALAATVSGIAATSAYADDATTGAGPGEPGHQEYMAYAPGQLQSTTESPSARGGMVTPQAIAQQFSCGVPWATVSNTVSGYVVGNCQGGANVQLTQGPNVTGNGEQYWGGKIQGGFDSCAWIRGDNQLGPLNAITTNTNCEPGNNSIARSSFILNDNQIWARQITPYTHDGVPVGNKNCTEFANYRPMWSGQTASQPLRAPAEDQGFWHLRYTAAYPEANTGYYYDMVRNATVPAGQGNWVFVQDACIKGKPAPTGPIS